jgi:hypothetical protein
MKNENNSGTRVGRGSAAPVRVGDVLYDVLAANTTATPETAAPAAAEHGRSCSALAQLPAGYALANNTAVTQAAWVLGVFFLFFVFCGLGLRHI